MIWFCTLDVYIPYLTATGVGTGTGTAIDTYDHLKTSSDDMEVLLDFVKEGMAEVKDARSLIIEALHDSNGFLPLHDKSDPETIYEELEMSKKVFKKAIGNLYKDKMIAIKNDGIQLL